MLDWMVMGLHKAALIGAASISLNTADAESYKSSVALSDDGRVELLIEIEDVEPPVIILQWC